MDKKKSDEEILFPDTKVGKYIIKPWSFGMLFEISPMLDVVLGDMDKKNININFEDDFISYTTLARIFALASIHVLSIISITLDVDEEEIRELSMEDGIKLAMIIYKQNYTTIKNVLSPSQPTKNTVVKK